MATKTRIVVQQVTVSDANDIHVGKYPRYIINLGNSITSITADELASAVGNAKDSANKAAASATAAKTSEQAAAASAAGASSAKTAAETAAAGAKASENTTAGYVGTARTEADRSKTEADKSAVSSAASEFSAQNSKTAENNAKESARLAKISETNAATSASTSGTEASRSKTEADRSKTEADKSAVSAAAAKVSETNAAGSATGAAGSKDQATTEADRAKSEADRAEAAADSVVQPEDLAGFVKTYKTYAEAVADLPKRFAGETVLIWNEGSAKYQWYKTFDNSGSLELQLSSEENKMMSVNNIRPDTNGNVQVTIPGGNPSLWLGEVTWFPYDKDNTVGYSGVLLGDGRELRRVDYPDVWTSIETGLIPSVTEAEWQAGSNMFFSKGNGTTTFRLPNLLQGQAFRAANAGEDGTEKVTAQVPYITMVNGIEPGADGKVVLDSGSIGGLGSMATQNKDNVDITGGYAKLKSDFVKPLELESANPTIRFLETDNADGDYRLILDGGNIRLQRGSSSNYVWAYNKTNNSLVVPSLEIQASSGLPVNQGGTGGKTVAAAKTNLDVDRLVQGSTSTTVGKSAGNRLAVNDGGEWGALDGSNNWIALAVNKGGTGGRTAEEARNGLQLGYSDSVEFSHLRVRNGLLTETISTGSNPSAPFVNRLLSSDGQTVIAQGEFRADANGSVSIINRSSGTPQFLSLDPSGQLYVPTLSTNNTARFGSIEVGVNNPNTVSYVDWHYAGDKDYDFRIAVSSSGATIGKGSVSFYGGVYQFFGDSYYFNNPVTMQHTLDVSGQVLAGSVRTNLAAGGVRTGTANQAYASLSSESGYAMLWRRRDGATGADEFLGIRSNGDAIFRKATSGTSYVDAPLWHSNNTTVDASGFIKRASPIIKIKADGSYELNEESESAVVTREGVGVYRISNILGLNSDAAWGGSDGGFEIPLDRNKQPRLWIDYEVMENGDVIAKTYHRTHPNAPAFAQNNIEGFENGDPMDIPSDTFISVRVEMPEDSPYNQWVKLRDEQAKAAEEQEEIE